MLYSLRSREPSSTNTNNSIIRTLNLNAKVLTIDLATEPWCKSHPDCEITPSPTSATFAALPVQRVSVYARLVVGPLGHAARDSLPMCTRGFAGFILVRSGNGDGLFTRIGIFKFDPVEIRVPGASSQPAQAQTYQMTLSLETVVDSLEMSTLLIS